MNAWIETLGPVAWPLFICSVLGFAVLLERLWFFSRTARLPLSEQHVMAHFASPEPAALDRYRARKRHPWRSGVSLLLQSETYPIRAAEPAWRVNDQIYADWDKAQQALLQLHQQAPDMAIAIVGERTGVSRTAKHLGGAGTARTRCPEARFPAARFPVTRFPVTRFPVPRFWQQQFRSKSAMSARFDSQNIHGGFETFRKGWSTLAMAIVGVDGVAETRYATYSQAAYIERDDDYYYLYISGLSTVSRNLLTSGLATLLLIENGANAADPLTRKHVAVKCAALELVRGTPSFDDAMQAIFDRWGGSANRLRGLHDFHLLRIRPQSRVRVVGFSCTHTNDDTGLRVISRMEDPDPLKPDQHWAERHQNDAC